MSGQPFTGEKRAFFEDYYALLGTKLFTERYNKHFGTSHSGDWAKKTATRIKCTSRTAVPSGFYSVAQISYLLGCTRQNVFARIQTKSIRVSSLCKGVKMLFVDEDEMDRLLLEKKSAEEPLPWPALKMPLAIKTLCMAEHSLLGVIRRGNIDAVTRGGFWYVRKEHVEWGRDQMVKHGFVRIPWYKMRERLKK